MQTKLTLRMDDQLIRGAKAYAARAGKSLSQVVAEYFSAITSRNELPSRLTPTVTALKGALKGAEVDVNDYRAHVEDKHL